MPALIKHVAVSGVQVQHAVQIGKGLFLAQIDTPPHVCVLQPVGQVSRALAPFFFVFACLLVFFFAVVAAGAVFADSCDTAGAVAGAAAASAAKTGAAMVNAVSNKSICLANSRMKCNFN